MVGVSCNRWDALLSGYMVLYTSKKEQEMDNEFIEKKAKCI